MPTRPERIAIAGASGFIGQALCRELVAQGHEVHVLGRSAAHLAKTFSDCLPAERIHNYQELNQLDPNVLINLSGENIAARRWRPAQKRRLLASRVELTEQLCHASAQWPSLHTFINASAIGVYGNGGDDQLSEASPPGQGFSAELCQRWENSARPQCRRIIARFAVVLDRDTKLGALAKMRPAFALGAGVVFGSGEQWQSYIHRHDAVQAIIFLMHSTSLSGVFNVCGPQPLSNRRFSQLLAGKLGRPLLLAMPEFVAKLLFGEMRELFYQSQRVVPQRLVDAGFEFRFASVDEMLDDALKPPLPSGK